MGAKIKTAVLILLIIVFAAVLSADIKASLEGYRCAQQLASLDQAGEEAQAALEEWRQMSRDRLVNAGAAIFVFAVVAALIVYVGPQQPEPVHVSKGQAAEYIRQIEEEYTANGQLVDESEEELEDYDFAPESLDTPVLLSAELLGRFVRVEWKPVPYAEGYSVYRRTGKKKWERVGRIKDGNTVFEDYALESDTHYIYTVKAYLNTEEQRITSHMDPLGQEVYVKNGNMPDAPQLHSGRDASGRAYIGWEPVEGAKSYRVLRRSEKGSWKRIAKIPASAELVFYREEAEAAPRAYTVAAACMVKKHLVIGKYDDEGITI